MARNMLVLTETLDDAGCYPEEGEKDEQDAAGKELRRREDSLLRVTLGQ